MGTSASNAPTCSTGKQRGGTSDTCSTDFKTATGKGNPSVATC